MIKKDKTGLLGQPNPPQHIEGSGRGRPPGAQNKTTVMLKEALFQAGQLAGERLDPKNKDHAGFVRYLAWLAKEYPNCYVTLLARMIPHTIRANVSGDAATPKSKVELQAMLKERGLPVENVFDYEDVSDNVTQFPQ